MARGIAGSEANEETAMWFLRFDWADADAVTAASAAWTAPAGAASFPAGPAAAASPWIYRSEDGSEGCAYVDLPAAGSDRSARLAVPDGITLQRLERLVALAGASAVDGEGGGPGAPAPWHYIVATDVRPEHEADFNAWYATEHLPGLAAVPGTIRAARYRVADGPGPVYHACYDLTARSVLDSAAWLAVRATPWSARVRPTFLGTRRIAYRLASATAQAGT